MKLDIILSKIKKLLALAGDSDSPEAASALEMAERLIVKYGIDRKEVEEAVEEFTKQLVLSKISIPRYELDLAIMVADFHDCVVVTNCTTKHFGLTLFVNKEHAFITGKSTNVEQASKHLEWLFGVVLVTYRKVVKRIKGVDSTNPLYMRSYWEGVLDALDKRLVREEEEVTEKEDEDISSSEATSTKEEVSSQSTSLVKASSSLDERESVRNWLRKNYAVREQDFPGFQYSEALVDGQMYLCGQTLGKEIELEGYKTDLLPPSAIQINPI